MNRYIMLLSVVASVWFVSLSGAAAQSACHFILRGKVIETESKIPVAYATVLIKELTIGAVTDENGNFVIPNLCRQTYTLEISHVECKKHIEQIAIEGNTEGTFVLQHEDKILNNVVIMDKRVVLETTQAKSELKGSDLEKSQGETLGEMLKNLAGVNSLNTGATISKPVVQGLHSDRILVFNNGVRQEGQQWGLDHAPEIDPFTASSISVVKGASGIKYGVGAIGGVILIEPKAMRDTLGIGGEVNLIGFSNGRSGVLSSMIEGKNQRFSWRIQGSAKKSGNLTTPQYYLSNTGVEELNGSAMLGFRWKSTIFEAYYSHFYSKIGILKDSHIGNLTDLKNAIERGAPLVEGSFSYQIDRPAQRINHDILKLKTTMPTGGAGRLSLMTFFQHNLREEFDAHRPGGKILSGFDKAGIAFQLPAVGLRTDWEHRPLSNLHGGGGLEGLYQNNNTYSGALIPDYQQSTIGAYWTERWRRYPFPLEIEAGIRYDKRHLQVDSTRFGEQNKQFDFGNMSFTAGAIYHIGTKGKISFNIGSAWRSPNVSELFSNGVHHGTASFESGNPDLSAERALNTSLSAHFDHAVFELDATLFQNNINGFIFLKPDSLPVLTIRGAFPAFSYQQTDAVLRGGDITATLRPFRHVAWRIKGSTLFARNKKTNEWLPLMPTDRIETSLDIENVSFNKISDAYAGITFTAVKRQNRLPLSIADYQTPPVGYGLVGVSCGGDLHWGKQVIAVVLNVDNLLNNSYREYLDRLRYFALTPGRNISLKLKMAF